MPNVIDKTHWNKVPETTDKVLDDLLDEASGSRRGTIEELEARVRTLERVVIMVIGPTLTVTQLNELAGFDRFEEAP